MTTHEVSRDTQTRLAAAAEGLRAVHVTDFGIVQNELEISEPRERAISHLWKWAEISPWLDKVYAGMSLQEVHRRTLALSNPGLGRPLAATTLLCSMSIYYPGDLAGVHRHTANASRFLLEGTGGYTTVGNEKCMLGRADLVITPNGEWHDHGNDGDGPIVWVNVLDIGLVETLNAIFTEWDYEESDGNAVEGRKIQSFIRPAGWSDTMFGHGGIVPRFGPEQRGRGVHSPKYLYQWNHTRAVLEGLRNEAGSPHDGVVVEYVNPMTGGPVVPTMCFQAHLLRPGEETREHRHTSSTVYTVVDGSGVTEVDGKRIEWSRNDIFVIPGWKWHRHLNAAADSRLYAVSDAPALQKLHLYREQEKLDDGTVREVHPWPSRPVTDELVSKTVRTR